MWVDQDGVTHTVWVPPEVILGEEAVTALRAVSRELADAAISDLDAAAMSIHDEAAAAAATGPRDLDSVDPSELEYPPQVPGLAPQPGEPLGQTVLRFLSEVPARWRVEAMEAVYDVLEPSDGAESEPG